ncbi:WD40-repeat containing protein [Gracilaria domingensis]|nr:WD40-repeat containing protein [Gracilaria domingensis]
MGANRLPPLPRTRLWAVAADIPAVAHAFPPAKLALFRAPNFAPEHTALPILPSRISLAGAESPSDPPLVLICTTEGHIYLSNRLILRLPSAPSALVHNCRYALVAAARTLTVIPVASPNEHTNVAHIHTAPPSAALFLNEQQALLASQQISLHELPSARLVARFAGHASPVVCLARLSSQTFVSAAARERILLAWRVQPQSTTPRKRRRLPPAAPTLSLASPRAGVRAMIADRHSNGAHFAAIVGSNEVVVWRDLPQTAKVPVECSFVVRAPDVPVVSVLFAERARLTVLYGQGVQPEVYTVDLASVSTELVELPSASIALITADKELKPNAKVQLVKQAVALQSSNVPAAPAASKRKQTLEDEAEEPDDQGSEVESDEVKESTIQEKLAALGVSSDTPRPEVPSVPALEATRLDSRIVILCQAVRVRDDSMFNRIIQSTQDETTIRNTVEQMPPEVATGALLDMLVDRLEREPRRVEKLLSWIRTILIEHAGTLVSQQRNQTLHALNAIIEIRTQNLEALARLEGRLELVVGQAQRQKRLKHLKVSTTSAQVEYTYDPTNSTQNREDGGRDSESEDSESESDSSNDNADDTGVMSDSESELSEHSVGKGAAQGNGDVKMNGVKSDSESEQSTGSEQSSEDEGD